MRTRVLPLAALGLVGALLLAGCGNAPAKAAADDGTDFSDLDLQATSSTGLIRGVVVDNAIRPIVGATLVLTPGNHTTTSTTDGRFGFTSLEPGTYFLTATKQGYTSIQASTNVVAGVAEPDVVRIQLAIIPGLQPYVDALHYEGFLTFGAAIFATSVGTTILPQTADTFKDSSIWVVKYDTLPKWVQGELVWQQTQPAGGEFIWEMTDTSNTHYGYRETTTSPALAYWNTTVLETKDLRNSTLDKDRGIAFRFFGGPHPLCTDPTGITFGCGLTVQQRADAFIHNFYNFVPPEGWRFTKDGDPVVPQ